MSQNNSFDSTPPLLTLQKYENESTNHAQLWSTQILVAGGTGPGPWPVGLGPTLDRGLSRPVTPLSE